MKPAPRRRRAQCQVLAILLNGQQRLVDADCWMRAGEVELPAFLRDPCQNTRRVFGYIGELNRIPVYLEAVED